MPGYRVEPTQQLLDKLMGPNRNGDREAEVITDFRDPRVCKLFLTGLCPYKLFVNTSEDLGPCPKTCGRTDLKEQ